MPAVKSPKSDSLQVRVTADVRRAILEAATKAGMSAPEWVRVVLARALGLTH